MVEVTEKNATTRTKGYVESLASDPNSLPTGLTLDGLGDAYRVPALRSIWATPTVFLP